MSCQPRWPHSRRCCQPARRSPNARDQLRDDSARSAVISGAAAVYCMVREGTRAVSGPPACGSASRCPRPVHQASRTLQRSCPTLIKQRCCGVRDTHCSGDAGHAGAEGGALRLGTTVVSAFSALTVAAPTDRRSPHVASARRRGRPAGHHGALPHPALDLLTDETGRVSGAVVVHSPRAADSRSGPGEAWCWPAVGSSRSDHELGRMSRAERGSFFPISDHEPRSPDPLGGGGHHHA